MRRVFVVTVDCDLRGDDAAVRQASLEAMLEVFAEEGLAGHVTWFLNENDFLLTENHQALLHEAVGRGDTLGLHDHLEPFGAHLKHVAVQYDARAVAAFCRASRERVAGWLAANGYERELRVHRNGCVAQAPEIYMALAELGYTVHSDTWPGHRCNDRVGRPAQDSEDIPHGIAPYRHDPANFGDYTSTAGRFLQVPLMEMFLAPFRFKLMDRWDRAFAERGAELATFTWCIHPYEVLTDVRDAVSPGLVEVLRDDLRRFRDDYAVEFASIDDLTEALGDE
ncbi:MAG: hypothetical protein U9R79_17995 [Armatimonadota bacterium]|nr:hypothetical protein [Armatimonadota bacterium]